MEQEPAAVNMQKVLIGVLIESVIYVFNVHSGLVYCKWNGIVLKEKNKINKALEKKWVNSWSQKEIAK